MKSVPSDRELVLQVLDGNEDAATRLFRKYFDDLFNFVYFRIDKNYQDAQDLIQEVFIGTWTDLARYELNSSFWLWLCGIAKRRLAKYYRKKNVRQRIDVLFESTKNDTKQLLKTLEERSSIPEEMLDKQEMKDLISASFSAISSRHRSFLSSNYLEAKSSKEIALEFKTSTEAVDSTLQRARAALKNAMKTVFQGF
ncbi:RNA polymerase sigma factor [Planctomycetota bacterium]